MFSTMYHYLLDTPIGWFQVSGTQSHITHSHWINEEDAVVGAGVGRADWVDEVERQFQLYFAGELVSFALPIDANGTAFQSQVWMAIQQLGFGQTTTYGQLAAQFGDPNKARAVGAATGDNPLLLLVPCHRVLGSDGALTGYAAGVDRKEWLLRHEGALEQQQLKLF
jgi:methylated-DNA-[protein]-cysteine S-methyltransferase